MGKRSLHWRVKKSPEFRKPYMLHVYDSRTRLVGDGFPDSTRVYRVKVVTAMLKAGVPLSKVDLFRDMLEEHGYALTSSTNLRQLIPFIHQEELSMIKQEILNQPLSIIFNGTTHKHLL